MKKIIVFINLLLLSAASSSAVDMTSLRSLFYKATNNDVSAEELVKSLKGIGENDNPILIGYKGMGYILLAKHVNNAFEKWKYFRIGRRYLELAIEKDFKNIELKFLRFAVQINAPFILNYFWDIEADKNAIIKDIGLVRDKEVRKNIINYLVQSKRCHAAEEKILLSCLNDQSNQ